MGFCKLFNCLIIYVLGTSCTKFYILFDECVFQVLLSRDEFATLSLLLADYEAADISVDLFAAGLLNLIADAEKVSQTFDEIKLLFRYFSQEKLITIVIKQLEHLLRISPVPFAIVRLSQIR